MLRTNNNSFIYLYCSIIPYDTPPSYFRDFSQELAKNGIVYFIDLPTCNESFSIKNLYIFISELLRAIFAFCGFYHFRVTTPLQLSIFKLFIFLRKICFKSKIILVTTTVFPDPIYSITNDLYVYDCIDRNPGEFENNEKVIRKFNLVFTNTKFLYKQIYSINPKVKLISSGYCSEDYSNTRGLKMSNSIVFFGGISHRVDYNLLLSTINALSNYVFVFIGEVYLNKYYPDRIDNLCLRKWKAIERMNNVYHLNGLSTHTARSLLPLFQVGIIPYDVTDRFNYYSHPIKLIEYLNCGLPVVSTALPTIIENGNRLPVYISQSDSEFIRNIQIAQKVKVNKYQKRIKKILSLNRIEVKSEQFSQYISECFN
jgi:hypothetical protein